MKVAALDFGSNTFLLLIADVDESGVQRVLHDEAQVIRLAQGVEKSKRFHPEALQRAEECLASFQRTIERHNVDRIQACATAAARKVLDPQPFLALTEKFGFPTKVISGETEAELTFMGAAGDEVIGETVLIDIGGASTEFVFGVDGELKSRVSIEVGSVNLTETYITSHPIDSAEMAKMTKAVQEKISSVHGQFPKLEAPRLLAVAGTATSIAALDLAQPFAVDLVDGYVLELRSLRAWVKKLADLSVEDKRRLPGMDAARADVIPAGALVLMICCQALNAKELEISTRGLRYGIALAMHKGML